ncbi:hypothetical protein V502_10501 [Pseudogymnoascus sp. VKM F-4520 (FW-2644)]|nr:hypothetical protein V502_10501 [Pseudogymnoascus sp. VKM F-4520 (FW-2644)]
MSSSAAPKPTTLVLGSTGGCALAFLVRALNAGYDCSALVRTPSKLTALLDSRGISQTTITRHLTIHTGNSKDAVAIAPALLIRNRPVDLIVSAVGGAPKFGRFMVPSIDDPLVCSSSMTALLSAVRALRPSTKPTVVAISSTGISNFGRDIPVAMVPLYHWLLAVPHADKKAMEVAISDDVKSSSPALGGFVGIRPSFLTNSDAKGVAGVKVGVEGEKGVESLAVGYTVAREDVGNWIFEEVLKGEKGAKGGKYENRFVTLTY